MARGGAALSATGERAVGAALQRRSSRVAWTWRVDPDALDRPNEGRTAMLSPFDRLVQNRERLRDLFDFDYCLEMYLLAAKRRWGCYALPVLHHDRFVGAGRHAAKVFAGLV